MFQTTRKTLAIPRAVPVQPLVTGATVLSFGWLLANDLIHPVVVYLLQLYLSF